MSDLTVATEILRQLGGPVFKLFTGAKDFWGSERNQGLSFKLPPCEGVCGRSRLVTIRLDPSDTYTIEVDTIGRGSVRVPGSRKEASDVYCDTLRETFTRLTGLYARF